MMNRILKFFSISLLAFFSLLSNYSWSQPLYWDLVNKSSYNNVNDIQCIDSIICVKFSLDKYQRGAVLEITNDGGNSWQVIFADTSNINLQNLNYHYIPCDYLSFNFLPKGKIILSRDSGLVWMSDDFGDNWYSESYADSLLVYYRFLNDKIGQKTVNLRNSLYKEIYLTFNSGIDWIKLELPFIIKWDMFLKSGLTKDGGLYIYTLHEEGGYKLNWVIDSGKKWKHIDYGNALQFQDMTFVNNEIGYAVRHDKNDDGIIKQVILKTVNSGETWYKVLDMDKMYGGLSRITHFDEKNILATGQNSFWILRSKDAGLNWHEDQVYGVSDKNKSFQITQILLTGEKSGFFNTRTELYKLTEKVVTPSNINFSENDHLYSSESILFYKNENIKLTIPDSFTQVDRIQIYDILGRKISDDNSIFYQFENYIIFDGKIFDSGIYYILMNSGNQNHFVKILIR